MKYAAGIPKSEYQKRIAERPDRYWSNEARKVLIEIYKKIGDRNKEWLPIISKCKSIE